MEVLACRTSEERTDAEVGNDDPADADHGRVRKLPSHNEFFWGIENLLIQVNVEVEVGFRVGKHGDNEEEEEVENPTYGALWSPLDWPTRKAFERERENPAAIKHKIAAEKW